MGIAVGGRGPWHGRTLNHRLAASVTKYRAALQTLIVSEVKQFGHNGRRYIAGEHHGFGDRAIHLGLHGAACMSS
jgi:hypothetical protein